VQQAKAAMNRDVYAQHRLRRQATNAPPQATHVEGEQLIQESCGCLSQSGLRGRQNDTEWVFHHPLRSESGDNRRAGKLVSVVILNHEGRSLASLLMASALAEVREIDFAAPNEA